MKKENVMFYAKATYLAAQFYFVIWPYAKPLLSAFLWPLGSHVSPIIFI